MAVERTKYRIYNLKTGQAVALIDADGTLDEEGEPQDIATLKELMRRELLVRDKQLGFEAEEETEGYELFPEESMCYFGMITLSPSDPEYLPTFVRYLPYLSHYEARPVPDNEQ
jgi:glycogen debranching enzyme